MNQYSSLTTPGLNVNFTNYVIELICLNVDKKLGPRFWKSNTYWKNKYIREIKGFHNLNLLLKEDYNFENPFDQSLLVKIIKDKNIKCLLAKKTQLKIQRLMTKYRDNENEKIKRMIKDIDPGIYNKEYMIDNSDFIEPKNKSTLQKLKEIEDGQTKKC